MIYGVIVVFVFLLSIGLTYAYFSIMVSGNSNDIKISVGTLELTYIDGTEIVASKIEPGWTKSKTINIENTGTLNTNYSLEWAELTNEIESDELLMSATCIQTKDEVVTGNCDNITERPVGNIAESIENNINIASGYKHTYVITFTFIETSSAQNYNQGKTFKGVINILGETYTLAGILYDTNGDQIKGATIEIHSNPKYGVTDENGYFEVRGLDEGTHEVNIIDSGSAVIATDTIEIKSGEEAVEGKTIIVSNKSGFVELDIDLSSSNSIEAMSLSSDPTMLVAESDTFDPYAANVDNTFFLYGPITRGSIESIKLVRTNIVPDDAIGSWDVSSNHSKRIMAWYKDEDSDGKYEVYIGKKGKVIANTNSSYAFCALKNLTELDLKNLNTSNVENMYYMLQGLSSLASLDVSTLDT